MEFTLEWRKDLDKKGMPKRQTLSRNELDAMTNTATAAPAEHDEE